MPRVITPVDLPQSDDQLRDAFAALATRGDVAALLAVSERELIYILYRRGKQYLQFDIPKRSGGTRHISAPMSSIKILQKRLNQVLRAVYRPKAPVHGFALERSIVTNADCHVMKGIVFNIDLKTSSLRSISVGGGVYLQVRRTTCPGTLRRFLPKSARTTGPLPQGAPTSLIVSNMVCSSLDAELRRLAADHGCTYTRYADDITFSTTQKALPNQIAEAIVVPGQKARCAWVIRSDRLSRETAFGSMTPRFG
jgi:RNA-directed DNA polymerase